MYKMNFLYEMDKSAVIGRKGATITYKDVVMDSEAMTIVLCLTGGRNAKLSDPFLFLIIRKAIIPYAEYLMMLRAVATERREKDGWTAVFF